jgi:hypothetical protein
MQGRGWQSSSSIGLSLLNIMAGGGELAKRMRKYSSLREYESFSTHDEQEFLPNVQGQV